MSELPQKRILPPRERRESASKRRELTPPVKPSPSPTPKKKTLPTKFTSELRNSRGKEYVRGPYNTKKKEVVVIRDASAPGEDEVLRTRVIESGPVPTTRTQQPEKLSSTEYQSIAESAVIASALHRSRMRWLCDGIFEKYWTKPAKKKGAPEIPPNNPDPKSMTKMQGTVTVTIEPHVFDAVFYTVREIPPAPAPQPKHANQPVKPAPPSTGYYPSPAWGPPPGPAQQPEPPCQIVPDRTIMPGSRPLIAAGPGQSPLQSPKTETVDIKMKGGALDPQRVMHTKDIRLRGGAPGPSTPATDPPKPNTDPVIQMLASRAATDTHLKELMKQVATSKATPTQLKEFQSHIDEFNALIKRQEAEGKRPGPGRPPSKSNTSASNSKPSTPAASYPATYSHPAGPPGRGTPIYSTPPPHAAGYPPYHPAPLSQSRPTPRPEPAITAIVFELATPPSYTHSASPDRWLFPSHAVLDTPHSGRGLEMIVSWFVERTGQQIKTSLGITADDPTNSQKWNDKTEYYQPVTMKLNCGVHKPLMTIAVNARSLGEVQRYMERLMKGKSRAREEWLAVRLPRVKGEVGERDGEFRDSGVEVEEVEEDELRDFWGCP